MVGIVALSVAGLAACGGNQDIAALAKGAHPSTSSSAVDPPANVTFNPANGSTSVNPTAPITVTAGGGTINTVSLKSSTGAVIAGSLSADKTAWTASQPLGYNHTYTATADALNTAGRSAQSTAKFTTLAPRNLTMPYIDTTSGGALVSGSTYGVGIVPVVHFDEKITDKAAAEKALVVTTTPAVTGAWYWSDSQNAHWRPETYYAPGTQVTVAANVFGLQVGSGLYGESNVSASFTIGAKHVSIADDNTHQVSVYFGDVLQRTMPTSMGKGGYATGSQGQHISFYTPSGSYTVIEKDRSVVMDSSTYGLPVKAPGGYKETIPYATKISTDGIYLHELDSTVAAQGHYDTSHGCLNLNKANAIWFQQNAQIGDVVQVVNTGGAPAQLWQNGDWTLTWAQWLAGSALPR